MKAEIISIGDEILIGQISNTNATWIAEQFNLIGISINQIISISDNKIHILETLKNAEKKSDIIIVTGGLGPTNDDITKNTVCEYFNSKLVLDKNSLDNIKSFLNKRGIYEVIENNHNQALVPDNCLVLNNYDGTAPGMWFNKNNKIYVFLPGVPHEMKEIVRNEVIPLIKKTYKLGHILHKTIYVQGIPEANLAQILSDWEKNLNNKIKLAYLPSPGLIKLRFSTSGEDKHLLKKIIDKEIQKLKEIIPNNLVNIDEKNIEETISEILKESKSTLSTAESCTGGYIAHLITKIPGSSDYYKGSIIAYSNDIKKKELKINQELIEKVGAVSKEVVESMAINIRKKFKTTYSIATSGIAGPTGGSKDKPVGTVWIAVASNDWIYSEKYMFGTNRERNIIRTANTALNLLINRIKK